MPSPIIETVRDIPLIVERDFPMECDNTGFPFDDDSEDQAEAPFRSQLDDIAARHPELAQHLGSFPFRSGSRTRTQIPEHFAQQRFPDRPFGEGFEKFGFPFDDSFREEEQKPYYQRYPKYYPKQNSQEESGEQSCSNKESQEANSEAQQESEEPQADSERGRRPKPNIQQSNTVDLGQRQEPVDDRTQRSMSAPPPNSRNRFVSSINIPVNQPSENANVAPEMPQKTASTQPQERVIPIHVEGRDEPVIPKSFASQSTSQPQAQPQPSQPCTDKFFTQRSPNFPQYFNRDQAFQNDWFPRGFQGNKPQPQSNMNQRGRSPQPQPKPEMPKQQTNVPRPTETQNVKMETEEPKAEEAPQPQVFMKPDPIDQIKLIQKDVSELMAQVDKFSGKPRDKQYLYLDEMLTRNLIKLDNIDTQGQENIRQARKEAIKCIEKCISILEAKANANAGVKAEEEVRTEAVAPSQMEVEIGAVDAAESTNPSSESSGAQKETSATKPEETMEIEPITAVEKQSESTELIEGEIAAPKNDSEKKVPLSDSVEASKEQSETDSGVGKGEDKSSNEGENDVDEKKDSNSGEQKGKKKIKKKMEK